jgi:hypothetical protein
MTIISNTSDTERTDGDERTEIDFGDLDVLHHAASAGGSSSAVGLVDTGQQRAVSAAVDHDEERTDNEAESPEADTDAETAAPELNGDNGSASEASLGLRDDGEIVIDLRSGISADSSGLPPAIVVPEPVDGLTALRARAAEPVEADTAADAAGTDLLEIEPEHDEAAAEQTGRSSRRRSTVEARRVYRVVRRIDAWSVLKISAIFFFCLWLVLMTTGVILWNSAVQSGNVDNIENLIATLLGFETFAFEGDLIFRVALLGGLTTVVFSTALTVLMSVLFNLISDLTGGIRVTVLQEESARRRIR